MAYQVFIDGAHGTTGLEIKERLVERDDLAVLELPEEDRRDPGARLEAAKAADVSILCLPDGAAEEFAAALPDGVRVIDTSTAHRVSEGWVYGMPELGDDQRQKIRDAARVANPGCHATGFLFLVRPLIRKGAVSKDAVFSSFSLTGYSGGGKKMIEEYDRYHAAGAVVAPMQYALGQSHKHLPEMAKYAGLDHEPLFSPVVGDFYKGMEVTVQLPADVLNITDPEYGIELIKEIYHSSYGRERLVRLADDPEDGRLYADDLADTDEIEITVSGNGKRILLASRFDNLGKGACGAAIQNLNLMLGIDEYKGLRLREKEETK